MISQLDHLHSPQRSRPDSRPEKIMWTCWVLTRLIAVAAALVHFFPTFEPGWVHACPQPHGVSLVLHIGPRPRTPCGCPTDGARQAPGRGPPGDRALVGQALGGTRTPNLVSIHRSQVQAREQPLAGVVDDDDSPKLGSSLSRV